MSKACQHFLFKNDLCDKIYALKTLDKTASHVVKNLNQSFVIFFLKFWNICKKPLKNF